MKHDLFVDKITLLLRHFREAAGMSQSEVADALRIGLRSYQRYESGESIPSIDVIYSISLVLKFELKDLFAPEDRQSELEDFKMYKGEDVPRFLALPSVPESKLQEIFNSPGYKRVLESRDVNFIRTNTDFMDSPFCLTITQPKHTFMNPTMQKVTGFHTEQVLTMAPHNDLRRLGFAWAIIMDQDMCHFEDVNHPTYPKGEARMELKSIFARHSGNYFILSLHLIEFQKKTNN